MKNRKTITLLILSVITAILVWGAFWFIWHIIKNKNEHSSVVIATLEEKMTDKQNASLFAEKFDEIKTLRNSLTSHFVDKSKVDEFVNYLEDLSLITNARITIVGIDIPEEIKNTIKIDMSIDGEFDEVAKTIKLLENIPYQTTINDLHIIKNIKPEVKLNEKVIEKFYPWHAEVSINIITLN